jgi:hypothetical protein
MQQKYDEQTNEQADKRKYVESHGQPPPWARPLHLHPAVLTASKE